MGKVDVNSEFFAPENARHHFGISTERSPTIIAQGPPAMSFNAFYQASEKLSFGFGIYDAAWAQGRDENVMTLHNPFSYGPDRAIFLEGKYQWQQGLADLPGQLKVGIWQLDSDQSRFDGQVQSNSEGYYLARDQTLTRSGIGMYLQYGFADEDVSPLMQHLGLGMQWLAPFPRRQQDIFGLDLSYVEFSDAGGAPYSEDHETAFEVFYKSPITDWFTLQGDLQQIVNPGGQGASDVLIASFRATFTY